MKFLLLLLLLSSLVWVVCLWGNNLVGMSLRLSPLKLSMMLLLEIIFALIVLFFYRSDE